jgi:hypothetical protein
MVQWGLLKAHRCPAVHRTSSPDLHLAGNGDTLDRGTKRVAVVRSDVGELRGVLAQAVPPDSDFLTH